MTDLIQTQTDGTLQAGLPASEAMREKLSNLLTAAERQGADAAEISLSASRALSVEVRARDREAIEFEDERAAGITIYRGQRMGAASTSDLSPEGLSRALEQALTIARFTEPDQYAGLANASDMARGWPDLSLYHPSEMSPEKAERSALALEAAALDHDSRIAQTEGASVSTQSAVSAYGNTHGFIAVERATRHALGCSAIARDAGGMQRESASSQARCVDDLDDVAAVGKRAATRALARLGARTPPTTTAPVLFVPRMARSLWGHLLAAISGNALYRNASFLKDQLESSIAASCVSLSQRPHIPRGLSSTGFDNDGVATTDRTLVDAGVLRGYLLGSYSARRLDMRTTGNAGGVFNPRIAPGGEDFEALVAGMGSGLVVTELMGQGVNLTSGDYSRGAAGYWVENGTLAYPVENATIAGNLGDMFCRIEAIGSDVDTGSALHTPSVLISGMTVAGQ